MSEFITKTGVEDMQDKDFEREVKLTKEVEKTVENDDGQIITETDEVTEKLKLGKLHDEIAELAKGGTPSSTLENKLREEGKVDYRPRTKLMDVIINFFKNRKKNK